MIRQLSTAILAVILAAPLLAQEAAPARFFIEKIEVRNARRVSSDVVIAESRLREGQEYTETDLRDAAARLSRLPFLLSAEFSLERGSERGRHVLVISINETKPFFYRLDIRPIFTDETATHVTETDSISASESEAFLGFRWFVGRRGAVHVGLQYQQDHRSYTEDYGAWAIGYTQYDIFGTRAFATLNLKRTHGSGSSITPQVVVGIPLSANQTVTLAYNDVQIEGEWRELMEERIRDDESQRVGSVTWSYNTTNHPYLPTDGMRLAVTPLMAWRDVAYFVVDYDPKGGIIFVGTRILHRRTVGLDVSAARFWEITDRSSFSAGADAGIAQSDDDVAPVSRKDYNSRYAIVQAGYSYSLWDRARRRTGDSRVEVNLRAAARTTERNPDDFALYRPDPQVIQLSAAWARRSSWGTLRLGAGYAW